MISNLMCGRKDLEALAPNFGAVKMAHDGSLAMAVIVSVAGTGDPYHAFARFFAPLYGVNEDPVTGKVTKDKLSYIFVMM